MSEARAQPAIPRISLTWLLVAQALVIVPHLGHLPLWVIGLWLGCAGWRVQIFRMRVGYPTRLAKAGLMLAAAAGVFASRGSLVGLDAGVVLLIAAFVLKLVELRSQRDALVLILLGFFCVVTAYLFDDSLLAAAYSLLPVSALLAALIGLQQSRLAMRPWPTLRLSLGLLAQALPLMLLLFVFFPRLGPLWALPNPNKALSGLSDSMAPADIAELSKSDELVFTATFDGAPPARAQLYWRALTLEHFDGRRWSQAPLVNQPNAAQWTARGQPWEYSVIAQASGRNWLFALDVARSEEGGIQARRDFSLQSPQPLDQPLQYRVRSWPEVLRNADLPMSAMGDSLQLPAQSDPRSRAWARELLARIDVPQILRKLFRDLAAGSAVQPAQQLVEFPQGAGDFINYLGVLAEDGVYGMKTSPYIVREQGPLVTAWTLLMSMQTGQPLLLCDAGELTTARTAATTAVAVDALAPLRAARLAIIGSGKVAQAHLRYVKNLRDWQSISLYSPSLSADAQTQALLKAITPNLKIVDSREAALAEADVIMLCTSSAGPVIDPAELSKPALIT